LEWVFLLDVDNTLLDNDRAKADLGKMVEDTLGPGRAARLWQHYEAVRRELDVVNYPEVMRRFALDDPSPDWQRRVAEVAEAVDAWPYARYLFPGALAVIAALRRVGRVAILSDGDQHSQPLKVRHAGLEAAVGGPANVLIFPHKEARLAEIRARQPGTTYVLIDDKELVLARVKTGWTVDTVTVWVRQGHYAGSPEWYAPPAPDLAVDRIADVPEALAPRLGKA
jgi:FMN phosphatase YigB (HAD superfamily)